MIRTVLTDAQSATMAPHRLGRECDPGRPGPDPRMFVEAVLWIARIGCPVAGLLLLPIIAAAAMSLSSVSVITNALRLRRVDL